MQKYKLSWYTALLTVFIFSIEIGLKNVQATEQQPLRFGIAAMLSPKDTMSTYRHIIIYLSQKLQMPVELVQRKTYDEMDGLIEEKNVPIAMICSGPYVSDHDKFGAELLVAAEMYGKAVYHAYLLAARDAEINSLEELKGKTFAFTDPKSNTGCLVPRYMLAKMGKNADTFFSNYVYSGHHSKSIEMVAKKQVDGAAVDHLIWEFMNKENPSVTSRTKIIAKSPAFGMPPIVVHPDIDSTLKAKIRGILLNMHKDEEGRKILAEIHIDRFIVPNDSDYDSVREMMRWLNQQK